MKKTQFKYIGHSRKECEKHNESEEKPIGVFCSNSSL